MPGVVVAAQLAQRRLIQLEQDLTELGRIRIAGGKTLPVDLAQRADKRVAVLFTDPAILVPVAAIQAVFLHVSLPMRRLRALERSVLPNELIGNGARELTTGLSQQWLRVLDRDATNRVAVRLVG
jgi:hypothetical protein